MGRRLWIRLSLKEGGVSETGVRGDTALLCFFVFQHSGALLYMVCCICLLLHRRRWDKSGAQTRRAETALEDRV